MPGLTANNNGQEYIITAGSIVSDGQTKLGADTKGLRPETQTDSIIQKIKEVFGSEAKVAIAVAQAEECNDTTKICFNNKRSDRANSNGTYDYGIFQINEIHKDMVGGDVNNLLDIDKNLDVAYRLWKAHGWNPWTTFKSGKYKNYL